MCVSYSLTTACVLGIVCMYVLVMCCIVAVGSVSWQRWFSSVVAVFIFLYFPRIANKCWVWVSAAWKGLCGHFVL